jgi:hypothetical protein
MLNEPTTILTRLAAADRKHQKEAGGQFLLCRLKYLWALLLVAFVLDAVAHLRPGWRLGLLLALLGGAAALAGVAWRIAFVRRNRLEHIARFLETRDPTLGSRLINLLQLRQQATDAALGPLTRDLARQAVDGYAAELRGTPLEGLAWTGQLRRHAKRAAWTLLAFAAVLAAFFRVTAVELARFVDPFGDHPPYSFTRLEVVDPARAGTNVLYGQGLIVTVKAAGHQPREVFLTAFPPGHPEKATTQAMFDKGRVGYQQMLDKVREELVLYAHTKDRASVSKQARVGVILTPHLERAFVQITPPAYTGLKAQEESYTFKGVQALEGSEVRFRLQSNRPLREGHCELITGEQPPQVTLLRKSAESEVAGTLTAKDSGRLRFSVVDTVGLPSQGDWEGALTVTHDLPPEIRIIEPEHDAFVAIDFKLQAHIEASDDYGLRSVRIHQGLNGVYGAPKVVRYDTPTLHSVEALDLDFAQMGVKPGDIVSLFAEAVDNAPEPHLSRSQTVRLLIISVEDYNNFLREQTDLADTQAKYAALLEELRELTEAQQQLGDAAARLQQQAASANPKARQELAPKLDDLLARQSELNRKLDHQAERMEQFGREQPVYDVEQDLAELLQQEAQEIRQSTAANDSVGRDIGQRSSPAGGGRQVSPDMLSDFKKASDEQVARLGGVGENGEQQIAQTLADMRQMQELQKDFNQFQALYQAQQELAGQAQAYNRAGQLSREDQLALKDLAATEKEVGEMLDQLAQKLRGDAHAAEKLFPKAAQSGADLADKIKEQRLSSLARQATSQMLAGKGDRSFRLADRLRSEMDKLFTDAEQGGDCPNCSELDSYLRLVRGMNPGQNFAQMARSKKFGMKPGQGKSRAEGTGVGQSGDSGYALKDSPMADIMGNEQRPQRGQTTARQSTRLGQGVGGIPGLDSGPHNDKPDGPKDLKPVNRQSGAVSAETTIEEYSDLVDSYFKAITTKKKP